MCIMVYLCGILGLSSQEWHKHHLTSLPRTRIWNINIVISEQNGQGIEDDISSLIFPNKSFEFKLHSAIFLPLGVNNQ